MDVQPDDRQVSAASETLRQTRTAIESSFFPWTVPEWNNMPGHLAVPTQLRLSGPNWQKRLALRPWSLVATTTTIEVTADPLCHISLVGALYRTDLDLDPDFKYWKWRQLTQTSSWTKGSCKAGRGMTINHFILLKKHFFILNDNKDKKHIILFQKLIKILYFRSKI